MLANHRFHLGYLQTHVSPQLLSNWKRQMDFWTGHISPSSCNPACHNIRILLSRYCGHPPLTRIFPKRNISTNSRITDSKTDLITQQILVSNTLREQQSITSSQRCSEPSTALPTLSSARVVDDPDSIAFYDSGLLTMPILWILLSALPITIFWTSFGSSPVLFLASFTDDPLADIQPFWLYVIIISCFFELVVVVLFSLLISTRGSQARTQHPRCRISFQILVFAALLTMFYAAILGGTWGYFAFPIVVGIYILCSLFMVLVEYVSH